MKKNKKRIENWDKNLSIEQDLKFKLQFLNELSKKQESKMKVLNKHNSST